MIGFLRFLVRAFMRVIFRYKIIHSERLPDPSGLIVAANHISAYDPPFVGAVFDQEINYLAKIELFRNPVMARLIKSMGAIPVKRGAVDRNAIFTVEERLKKGEAVLIFPEGTRRSSRVKPGIGKIALETESNILPVYIKNSDRMKDCFLGRTRLKIVIGEIIEIRKFMEAGINRENYRAVSEHVMEKIRELDDEC